MKHTFIAATVVGLALGMSGCAHQAITTNAVMTYDGSSVDYSKIDTLKRAKVCKDVTSADGDTTIIAAAKAAKISKIKHVDSSFEYTQVLFWPAGQKNCVTVYGE